MACGWSLKQEGNFKPYTETGYFERSKKFFKIITIVGFLGDVQKGESRIVGTSHINFECFPGGSAVKHFPAN